MRSQQQQPEQNPLGMLQQLGISLDPVQQLSGLVNLINQTQAPQIQQNQFADEMAYRQMNGDRQFGLQESQAQMQEDRYAQQDANAQKGFGLQERQLQQTGDYQKAMVDDRGQARQDAEKMRGSQNAFDFMRMLLATMSDPRGQGRVNPEAAANVISKGGFPDLINPQAAQQQPMYDTSMMNPELDDAAFQQSFMNRTQLR